MPSPTEPQQVGPMPVTMLGLVAALLRHIRFVLVLTLLGGGVAAAWALLAREQFASTLVFAPGDQPSSPLSSGLAALGSQFGASFTMDEGTRSLQFYAELLRSHDLLAALAADSFPDPDRPGARAPLTAILRQRGATPARTLDHTVEFLRDHAVRVTINDRTGMITMVVVLASPELAADVATRLYGRLEAFNTSMRQASAANRLTFATRELASARTALENAEGGLRAFLEQNRGGVDMPRLALERGRLQRRIDVAQIAFSQMTQEFTEATIAEARDTHTFVVIQHAVPPLERSYPLRTRLTIMGAILGGALACVIVALRVTAGSAREQDPSGFHALTAALRRRRAAVLHHGMMQM